MALHYYITVTSFQKVSAIHMTTAIKSARCNGGLLFEKRHSRISLLKTCYRNAITQVTKCALLHRAPYSAVAGQMYRAMVFLAK